MQTNERHTRRLATLFLGLFLSLLAMVSLHDFSHRADAVQGVVSTEGYTSHMTKTDCSICHFVHTPFLALAIGTLLAAVALGVRLLGVRLVRLAHSIRRDAVQLRAPPTSPKSLTRGHLEGNLGPASTPYASLIACSLPVWECYAWPCSSWLQLAIYAKRTAMP